MADSAARAERFDLDVPIDRWYTWQVEQKPVTAKFSFALIDRLEREALEGFRSLSSRGSEIGGILLGRATPGTPHAITVEDFTAVPCDYSRGPLYRLSESDIARFRPAMEKKYAADALSPVGFFRSHTRKNLSLDEDDLAVLDALFTAPHHIALVIRPFATKASMAGIFLRENGTMRTESSYLEFPFRSTQLVGTAPEPEPEPEPEPAPVKATPRAQIVPIASRREIALESFVPPAPAKEIPVAVEAASAPAVEAAAPLATPAMAETVQAGSPEPPTSSAGPAAPAVPAAAPAPMPEPAPFAPAFAEQEPVPADSGAKSNKMLLLGLGALVPLLAMVLLFVYPGWMRQKPSSPAVPVDSSPLAMRVERTGNEILLTWKPDSDQLKSAGQAVLQISDGPQQENVTLDAAQFHSGRIVYSPGTADVVFRMEVTGRDGAKLAGESLRVLGSRPSAFDAAKAAAPETHAADPAPTEVGAPAEEEDAVKRTPQELRPFNAPLSQRLRPARPADLPDAPLVTRVEAAPPSLSLNLGVSVPTPPPAPPPAAAAPTSPVQAPVRTAAKVVQAEVVRRVTPEYPKMARDSGVKGVVQITAKVGADGRVKSIQSVTGPAILQKPAVDAVKQWLYKPTTLNGNPVESDTVITLKFGSN